MTSKTGFYIIKPNIYAKYTFRNYIQTQFDEENWNFYFKNTKNLSGIFNIHFETQITTLFKIAREITKLVLKLP